MPTEFGKNVFIANQILYKTNNIVDLSAEVFLPDKKTQLGQDLTDLPTKADLITGYSQYDGSLLIHENALGEELLDS